jgi:peptidyl-prolyl cis-trans isomerase C
MTLSEAVRAGLREPLVHFLGAGLLVFAFSALTGSRVDPESRTITVTAEQVQQLGERWTQTWQRPPTQTEIDGLIRDSIKEEVYYREAIRLSLDQDDAIIRRRLRSKMEYLAASTVETAVPDEATLQAWLDKFPQKYAADPAYDFDQIYLKSGDEAAAGAMLDMLRKGAGWASLGDPISLPKSLEATPQREVVRIFGDDFAEAVGRQTVGGWVGPIQSGFGFHLVRVRSARLSKKPKLVDVRQVVENDWRAATLKNRETKAYHTLLDSYSIKIAKP